MLHTVTSSYRELARIAGLTGRPSSSERNKQSLLDAARRKLPRPRRATKLGKVLSKYTTKKSQSYDPVFDKQIRGLAPQWFVTRSEIANQKKRQLIGMARRKLPRPKQKTKIGSALCNYTSKRSPVYDADFDRKIRRIAPHWFFAHPEIDKQKKRLLDIVSSGDPRPNRSTDLGKALRKCTTKTSSCYDPAFINKVRRIDPQWLATLCDIAGQKKRLLLGMARKGRARPKQETPLGKALFRYTSKKCPSYDPDFDKQIRGLAPQWFVTRSEIANQKKQRLIEMARRKLPKPSRKTKLGEALSNYTQKTSDCYDPDFDRKIRRTAPQWFAPISAASDRKKRMLLGMARKGCPRPKWGSHPLGIVLSNYTRKTAHSYDPVFTKQIRKLAPHWFKRCSTR
jgi:hypothetical protein